MTDSKRTRVLLIDDDQGLNTLLARYLGRFNFDVRATVDPYEGLQALESEPPDIVILDVMLPEMDGFAVCRKVRERSRVPIVMLTARGDVRDRIVGLELGADDYVSKILDETHGIDLDAYDRSIDVLVSRLRQKLGDDPRHPTFIRTVRGTGYRFTGDGDE
jgi:DNA-binding response OmpR family regulator